MFENLGKFSSERGIYLIITSRKTCVASGTSVHNRFLARIDVVLLYLARLAFKGLNIIL